MHSTLGCSQPAVCQAMQRCCPRPCHLPSHLLYPGRCSRSSTTQQGGLVPTGGHGAPGSPSPGHTAPSASLRPPPGPCRSLSPGQVARGCVGCSGRRQAAARASPTPRDGWHICARRGGCGVGWGTQAPWGTAAAGWAAPGVWGSPALPPPPPGARWVPRVGGTAPGATELVGVLGGHPRRGCSGCRLGMGASPCQGPRWCRLSSERANSVHGRGAGEAGLLPCWACASAAGRQPAIEPRRGRHRAAVLQGPGDGDTRGPPPRPQPAAWERGHHVAEVGPEQWPCWEGKGEGGGG